MNEGTGVPLDKQALAEAVVGKMRESDAFSQWFGIDVLAIAPRRSTCRMRVRADMVNGFGVAHGGVTYSLADSALAFACNTHGRLTVAVENNIGYPLSVEVGDVLTAHALEQSATHRLGFYSVTIRNQRDDVVAVFRGTVYRTKSQHFSDAR